MINFDPRFIFPFSIFLLFPLFCCWGMIIGSFSFTNPDTADLGVGLGDGKHLNLNMVVVLDAEFFFFLIGD